MPPYLNTALCGALLAVALAMPARGDERLENDPAGRFSACERMLDWISQEPIGFRQSSATLSRASYPVLERLAELAHDCPDTRIRITGHTDAVGGPEFNQHLSEQRAAAVADYLVERGIERDRLLVQGAGASRPVADNATAYGRELNRRIELELLPTG